MMKPKLDLQALHAFIVVARELNLRAAADKLKISEPPLSRKIKKLEEELGLALFIRHCRGLELTEDGRKVLEMIRPLFTLENDVAKRLEQLAANTESKLAVGLSTAFEQGIYANLERRLWADWGNRLALERASSPVLARKLCRGELALAWIALPLEASDLVILRTGYAENLVAVLPESWQEAANGNLCLQKLNGRPFFWFPPLRNPAWHARMARVFSSLEFAPPLLAEPEEHDVLLARIAAGDGFALMPASFAAIRRAGVVFKNISGLPPLELGIACGREKRELAVKYVSCLLPSA